MTSKPRAAPAMSERQRVWIVEMWNPRRRRWEPTVGCALCRVDCYRERRLWQQRNPSDSFRVAAYLTVEGSHP